MKKYFSDEDYIQAEYVIYNDLNDDLLPGVSQMDFTIDEDAVKQILKQGEKWVDLKSYGHEGYILTSFARIINCKLMNQLSITISNTLIHTYIQSTKFYSLPIFEQLGWEFDKDVIEKRYRDNNWKFTDFTT